MNIVTISLVLLLLNIFYLKALWLYLVILGLQLFLLGKEWTVYRKEKEDNLTEFLKREGRMPLITVILLFSLVVLHLV